MARIYLLTIILIAILSMAMWKPTNAFFMDSTASAGNVFAASATFPSASPSGEATSTPTQTPTITPEITVTPQTTLTPTTTPTSSATPTPTPLLGKIVINEISPIGNNDAEWVELYNSGGTAINVTGWHISDATGTSTDTFPTTAPIQPNSYAVIVTTPTIVSGIPVTATTIILQSTTIGNGLNNTGGDIVRITDSSSTLIDEMGYGTNTVFPTGVGIPGAGQSLARTPNGQDTNTATDWIVDTTPSLGITN